MKTITLIVLLLCIEVSFGQKLNYDQFKISDVKYLTEERQKLFLEFEQGNINLFKQFYFTSNKAKLNLYKSYEKQFDAFIDNLKLEISSIKKPTNTKIIEFVNKSVNENYLKTIDFSSSFFDLLETGRYNFTTAPAMYALVLNKLEIPFYFSETPTHCEIVVYPSEESLKLIGPGAENGLQYYVLASEFKVSYNTKLSDNKIISSKVYESSTTDDIFNSNFYLNQIDKTKEIIAVLLYKECLEVNSDHQSDKSLYNAMIANIYNPSFRGNMLIMSTISVLLSKRKYESFESAKQLEFLARIPYTIEETQIFSLYEDMTEKVLFERNDLALFDTCSKFLLEKTPNLNFKNHVTSIYNRERGRYYLLQYNYNKAIPNLLIADTYNPQNLKLRSMLVEAIFEKMKISDGEDTVGFIGLVDKDSFLLDDNRFRQLYAIFLEDKIFHLYKSEQFTLGDKYLLILEKILKLEPSIAIEDPDMRRAFAIPARHYQRLKNLGKARDYVNRGLIYFPKDPSLRELKAVLK